LSLAQHLGISKFIIQADNIQVSETILDGGFWAISSADFFNDCRILFSGLRKYIFEHCNREANEETHELSRYSFMDHVDWSWDDDPLAFYFLNS
jgi:hypothetical protein